MINRNHEDRNSEIYCNMAFIGIGAVMTSFGYMLETDTEDNCQQGQN